MNNIVKFKEYDNSYRGKFVLMSKHKNDSYLSEEDVKNLIEKSVTQALNNKLGNKKPILKIIVQCITIVLTILGTLAGAFYYFDDKLTNINDRIDLCPTKQDIEKITSNIEEIEETSSEIYAYLYNDEGVKDQLGEINEVLNIKPISASIEMLNSSDIVSIESNDVPNLKSSFTANTSIGTDKKGNVYIAENYINKPIFLIYTENNQEVYFFGQYNENYHWNGYCVTNAYNSDGVLISICESNFDDGKRIDYKSFYQDSGDWIYSHRKCTDENTRNDSDNKDEKNNIKETIKYKFVYNDVKNFTITNVRTTDIIHVDDFIKTINPIMLSYYHGDTSDGKYNDDTENAYLINYFEDGTVKTLYFGNFKDGKFDDFTGNAWYIVKDDNTDYMYYKGFFEDGITKNNEGCIIGHPPLNRENIDNYLKENNCKLKLNWKL